MSAKQKCKAGDIAFIVAAEAHPENLGKLVMVIRKAQPKIDFSDDYLGLVWVCESASVTKLSVSYPDGKTGKVAGRPIRDAHLLPIRPGRKSEKRETEKELQL